MNGLSNLPKTILQKNTKEPKLLTKFLRKKVLTKIATNTQRNNLYITIRYYLNKWKDSLNEGKLKVFNTNFFSKNVGQNAINKIF